MNNTQRIVRALELALRDSTTQIPSHCTIFRKPQMIDVVDGETLKAAVQAIINISKEDEVEVNVNVSGVDNVSYMKSDDLAMNISRL